MLTAAIGPNDVETGADQGFYEGQRNEALAIGYNFDSMLPGSKLTITSGSNTSVDVANDLFNSTYLLRCVTINTDQWLTLTLSGTGINAATGGNSVITYIPIGSFTVDLTNVTAINYANSSGNTATVFITPLTMRTKNSLQQ